MTTKKKRRRRRTWSVPRIQDPRYPGITVRVAEIDRGGNLQVIRMVEGRQRMASLGVKRNDLGPTNDEQERSARALGLDVIAQLAQGGSLADAANGDGPPEPTDLGGSPLTLDALAAEYEKHGLHGRSPEYQRDQPAKLRRVARFLGGDREVRSLSRSDVERFEAARKAQGRRQGSIWSDLVALKGALNWACEHRGIDGQTLLDANPLQNVKLRNERSPRRPVASEDRYRALRKVAGRLPDGFGLMLDLAWETGHRIGAILNLRWSDVDLEPTESAPHGSILWRSEHDKTGNQHRVPINKAARKALLAARGDRPGIGDALVFPSDQDSSTPVDRHLASRWLRKAEDLAELEHIWGLGWHGFRRAWATRRKHFPVADVAAAGGWRDHDTMLRSYQHSDPATVLGVVNA